MSCDLKLALAVRTADGHTPLGMTAFRTKVCVGAGIKGLKAGSFGIPGPASAAAIATDWTFPIFPTRRQCQSTRPSKSQGGPGAACYTVGAQVLSGPRPPAARCRVG